MKVFFYSADREVPISEQELYHDLSSQNELIVSNYEEYVDDIETHKGPLMDLVSEGVMLFVPMEVKGVFLRWLKEKDKNVDWKKEEATPALPPFEILGDDDLKDFLNNSMKVQEEWKGVRVLPSPPPELKQSDGTVPKEESERDELEKAERQNFLLVFVVLGIFIFFIWLWFSSGNAGKYTKAKEYVQQGDYEKAKKVAEKVESLRKRVEVAYQEIEKESVVMAHQPVGRPVIPAGVPAGQLRTHRVQRDQTLQSIARRYGVSSQQIFDAQPKTPDGKEALVHNARRNVYEKWAKLGDTLSIDWELIIPPPQHN